MHIHCLGINHQTAQVGLRERMALREEQIKAVLRRLTAEPERRPCDLTELVILSTCNRVEIYAASHAAESHPLLEFLADVHGIRSAEFKPYLYHYVDQAATHHLYRVAAGLDSLVLGEAQILGQVTRSLELAQGQKAMGPILSRLFRTAIHAGKRARTETEISRNPASISSLAADLAERNIPDLAQRRIVIIGAGEMGELAVEALRKRGAADILVVNRTLAHAFELAERWNAQVTSFERLDEALASADILITSTGAPHFIVDYPRAIKMMKNRRDRPLMAIDIAVPRDIEQEVGSIPGICLYDIDSLNQELEHSLSERLQEVPRVEAILAEEEASFMEFFKTIDILPLIADLSNQAEAIRQKELEKTMRRMPDLTEREMERIEALTQALVKKLISLPITRLREEAQNTPSQQLAGLVRKMYDLEDPDPERSPTSEPYSIRSNIHYTP